MSRSILDLPPNVKEEIFLEKQKELKGCRVRITVDEPGFSDARVIVKFPHGDLKSVIIGPGDSFEYVHKAHLQNQVVLEALPREGDPMDPDMEGGQ
jgi:hypothetical protein